MVPSLSIRVLVACRYAARVRTDCRGKVVGGCLKYSLKYSRFMMHGQRNIKERNPNWSSTILWLFQ